MSPEILRKVTKRLNSLKERVVNATNPSYEQKKELDDLFVLSESELITDLIEMAGSERE